MNQINIVVASFVYSSSYRGVSIPRKKEKKRIVNPLDADISLRLVGEYVSPFIFRFSLVQHYSTNCFSPSRLPLLFLRAPTSLPNSDSVCTLFIKHCVYSAKEKKKKNAGFEPASPVARRTTIILLCWLTLSSLQRVYTLPSSHISVCFKR